MPTLDRTKLGTAAYWQDLSDKFRADANAATDFEHRRTLLGFAEGYENLAKRIDSLDTSTAR